jgi:CheY-like chemotaxis protein
MKINRLFNRDAGPEAPMAFLHNLDATDALEGSKPSAESERNQPDRVAPADELFLREQLAKRQDSSSVFIETSGKRADCLVNIEEPASKDFAIVVNTPEATFVLPDKIRKFLRMQKLAFIGFDEADKRRIARAFEPAGIFPYFFQWSDIASLTSAFQHFNLLLLNVLSEEPNALWAHLDTIAKYQCPTLLAGDGRFLAQHSTTMKTYTRDLLFAPWNAEEIALRSYHMLFDFEKQPVPLQSLAMDEKIRVVAADDDPTTLALISIMLKKNNIEGHIAHNGKQALELIRSVAPHAIIADVNMPHMDGFEVLAALKNEAQTRHIPTILLTARQQEMDIIRAFGLGADDYLTKPFSPMELLARLQRLIKKPS